MAQTSWKLVFQQLPRPSWWYIIINECTVLINCWTTSTSTKWWWVAGGGGFTRDRNHSMFSTTVLSWQRHRSGLGMERIPQRRLSCCCWGRGEDYSFWLRYWYLKIMNLWSGFFSTALIILIIYWATVAGLSIARDRTCWVNNSELLCHFSIPHMSLNTPPPLYFHWLTYLSMGILFKGVMQKIFYFQSSIDSKVLRFPTFFDGGSLSHF